MSIESNKKIFIKNFTLDEMEYYFGSIGEPKFRAKQVFKWLYNKSSFSFDDMNDLPKNLRNILKDNFKLNTLEIADIQVSQISKTKKFLFKVRENTFIESVIIPKNYGTALCISTQAGCPLDCKFCATGLMGFKKNLTSGEIIDQYLLARKNAENPITHIVYMGMGEPLLNFDETVKSLNIFANEITEISKRNITVSTAGIPDKIKKLAECNLKVKLAFSLHSCFEKIRSKIMPINLKYSLAENLNAIKFFQQKTKTRITFEYLMLNGINDRNEDINALVKISKQIPSKINILPFNSINHIKQNIESLELKPTSIENINSFIEKLAQKNVSAFFRKSQGYDIAAACGQLAIEK